MLSLIFPVSGLWCWVQSLNFAPNPSPSVPETQSAEAYHSFSSGIYNYKPQPRTPLRGASKVHHLKQQCELDRVRSPSYSGLLWPHISISIFKYSPFWRWNVLHGLPIESWKTNLSQLLDILALLSFWIIHIFLQKSPHHIIKSVPDTVLVRIGT